MMLMSHHCVHRQIIQTMLNIFQGKLCVPPLTRSRTTSCRRMLVDLLKQQRPPVDHSSVFLKHLWVCLPLFNDTHNFRMSRYNRIQWHRSTHGSNLKVERKQLVATGWLHRTCQDGPFLRKGGQQLLVGDCRETQVVKDTGGAIGAGCIVRLALGTQG